MAGDTSRTLASGTVQSDITEQGLQLLLDLTHHGMSANRANFDDQSPELSFCRGAVRAQ